MQRFNLARASKLSHMTCPTRLANSVFRMSTSPMPLPSVAQRIERPPPRPPTPTIQPAIAATVSRTHLSQVISSPTREFGETARDHEYSEWELQEDQTRAIILLQRLLRGRAIQNMMFEVRYSKQWEESGSFNIGLYLRQRSKVKPHRGRSFTTSFIRNGDPKGNGRSNTSVQV